MCLILQHFGKQIYHKLEGHSKELIPPPMPNIPLKFTQVGKRQQNNAYHEIIISIAGE